MVVVRRLPPKTTRGPGGRSFAVRRATAAQDLRTNSQTPEKSSDQTRTSGDQRPGHGDRLPTARARRRVRWTEPRRVHRPADAAGVPAPHRVHGPQGERAMWVARAVNATPSSTSPPSCAPSTDTCAPPAGVTHAAVTATIAEWSRGKSRAPNGKRATAGL